jgi:hypothetical protein
MGLYMVIFLDGVSSQIKKNDQRQAHFSSINNRDAWRKYFILLPTSTFMTTTMAECTHDLTAASVTGNLHISSYYWKCWPLCDAL